MIRWTRGILPGEFVAVAYRDEDPGKTFWWEAQVWYIWRRNDTVPCATVYDCENNIYLQVEADDLES